MTTLTEGQRAILEAMDRDKDREWWIPNSFTAPVIPMSVCNGQSHYQTVSTWALPKLKALAKRGLVEQRQGYDAPGMPDYAFRITAEGRAAI